MIDKFTMNRQEWYGAYRDLENPFDRNEEEHERYENLPEVTITAFTEAGLAESSIPVINQRRYQGRMPVIPSDPSGIPCSLLGAAGVLNKLNIILGTSYTVYTAGIHSLISTFIANNSDFGTAYAHLRPFWFKGDFTDAEDGLRTHGRRDRKMREDIIVKKRLIHTLVPPRRVWDLYSNRVVPWWVARQDPDPISHAWVEERDRVDVLTLINGKEWPVPMPKDADLNLIRIEMLNAGVEYAWLDVLCLRQVGGLREDLRAEEWKVDVPTIGAVYIEPPVMYYFNGLGRPLRFKAGDFESDRSWFRRAWTLQETSHDIIMCGDTGDVNVMEVDVRAEFDRQIQLMKEIRTHSDIFSRLSIMRDRLSTNPVDKVAGLGYLLGLVDTIPAYYEMQSIDDAWTALVNVLDLWSRGNLFYAYPKPGNGNKVWRPSWSQILDKDEVLPLMPRKEDLQPVCWIASVKRTDDEDSDWCEAVCIEWAYVQGLAEGSQDGKDRQGGLIVEDDAGERYTFKINANHQYHIPDGLYTLVGNVGSERYFPVTKGNYWVVGQRLPDRKFKKVSVFQILDKKEVKRLEELGVSEKKTTFLA